MPPLPHASPREVSGLAAGMRLAPSNGREESEPVRDAMPLHLRKRAVTHRRGRLWIRRTGSKTYDIMFRPTGNGEFRITSEDGLRAFLWGATVPFERIEEAVTALRSDTEHEIPNVTLTLERMRKLGL